MRAKENFVQSSKQQIFVSTSISRSRPLKVCYACKYPKGENILLNLVNIGFGYLPDRERN